MLNYNPFAFVLEVAIAVAVLLLCEPLMLGYEPSNCKWATYAEQNLNKG